MKRAVAILLLLMPSLVLAAPREPNMTWRTYPAAQPTGGGEFYTGVNGAALNNSTASTTRTIDVTGWSVFTVQVDLTRSAATDLQMICYKSLAASGSTNFGRFLTMSCASGTCTDSNRSDTIGGTISTSGTFISPDIPINARRLYCTFSGTSAGGSDTIAVSMQLGAAP